MADTRFDGTLRGARDRIEKAGRSARVRVTAEVFAGGSWLELVARTADGRMVARTGWSLEHFGEDTLEDVAEWLEHTVARAEGRHLRVVSSG